MALPASEPGIYERVEFASWIATSSALFLGAWQLYQGRSQAEQDTLFRLNDQVRGLADRMRNIDPEAPDAEVQYLDTLRDSLNLLEIYALGVSQGHFSRNAKVFVIDFLRSEFRSLLTVDDVIDLIREHENDRNRLKHVSDFIRNNGLIPEGVSLGPETRSQVGK